MIEVYKILTNTYDVDVNLDLQLHSNVTRGHNLKLANVRCHCDLQKYTFPILVVNI